MDGTETCNLKILQPKFDELTLEYLKLTSTDGKEDSGHIKNTDNDTNLPLINLPQNTKWSDISIRWLNGNDVEIKLKNDPGFKKTMDYKELGFYDEKRKGPNILWRILLNAASPGRQMTWSNLGGISESDRHKKIDNFQKQISLLRGQLRKIFGALPGSKHEPLISHSNDKEYSITINLIPEKNAQQRKEESWEDLLSDAELSNYENLSKKEYIKNPNQLPNSEDNY